MANMVYIMTNSADGNGIAAFRRMNDGTLTPGGIYKTGGAGSGPRGVSPMPGNGIDPLQSQGSIALSRDRRFLFAVNAGSDSISSFRVSIDGSLSLTGTVPAGAQPVCLCQSGNMLYAAHAGSSPDNLASGIWGYTISGSGALTIIRGSGRSLSMTDAHPSCITPSPDGRYLVVSELNTNRLSVYGISWDGTLSGPAVSMSNGQGPFGSVFLSSGLLLVSEAGANALTSYIFAQDGMLSMVNTAPNGQIATCWVASTPNGRYAYTANAGSGTISAYGISMNGVLRLIDNIPSTMRGTMGAPIDCGVSNDGRNFYVLNGNQGSVSAFRIDAGGKLTLLQLLTDTELPSLGSQGMAVL